MYSLRFDYNRLGRGLLLVYLDDSVIMQYLCRTGSINAAGQLVNACPPDEYNLLDEPKVTPEAAMIVDGFGWKWRLYRGNEPTRLLVHPDGGKGGTEGCLGIIDTSAKPLYLRAKEMIHEQPKIKLFVRKEAQI